MKAIADFPPDDMHKPRLEIDCQCARCGSSCDRIECHDCGGEGYYQEEEDFETETVVCQTCRGRGGWMWCLSSPEFCSANPVEGREAVERGKIEWFTIEIFGHGLDA